MEIVLLGASNPEAARMILAVQRARPEFRVLGFIDNDPAKQGTSFFGHEVIGDFELLDALVERGVRFVNLITRTTRDQFETSRDIAARGGLFENFIHPSVDLTMVTHGAGLYVQEAVILQAEVRIGDNSSVGIGTLINHETSIGNSVFIAHGCSVSGKVAIGDGAFIGTHAAVLPRVTIGKWATVGAGAVVTKDVPDYATVVGVPARVIKISAPVHAHGDIFAGTAPG